MLRKLENTLRLLSLILLNSLSFETTGNWAYILKEFVLDEGYSQVFSFFFFFTVVQVTKSGVFGHARPALQH